MIFLRRSRAVTRPKAEGDWPPGWETDLACWTVPAPDPAPPPVYYVHNTDAARWAVVWCRCCFSCLLLAVGCASESLVGLCCCAVEFSVWCSGKSSTAAHAQPSYAAAAAAGSRRDKRDQHPEGESCIVYNRNGGTPCNMVHI